VSLERPPPPPPPPPQPSEAPPPGPPDDAQAAAGPPEPAPQKKITPPPPLRPRQARTPPPNVETLPTPPAAPAPPAVMATVSDGQLAGAIRAGQGRGGGAGGSGGGGGGDGAGCDLVERIQEALRTDPEVRATVGQAHRAAGSRGALLVWNGDWVRAPGEAGKGLAGVRQAIALEVAFAPDACRAQAMRGLVLISFADGSRVAMGRGAWRWTDLLS